MIRARRWPAAAAVVTVLLVLAPGLLGQSQAIDIELGDEFTGTIDSAGVDVVQARFYAPQGTALRVVVQADPGSTLQPTLVLRNEQGVPLDNGSTVSIGWLPVANLVHHVTVPVGGIYVAEVGGSSGDGGFWARVTGSTSNGTISTLSGTVRSSLTAEAIAGADVFVADLLSVTTDGSGQYSIDLPAGSYGISVAADGFESFTTSVGLSSGAPLTLDVDLTPLVPVDIATSVTGDMVPGGEVLPVVDVVQPPGSDPVTYSWTQVSGPTASIAGGNTASPTVTLGAPTAYKDHLLLVLSEPPVGEDELPPNVPLPPGEAHSSLQDRFQVVPFNPFSLEEGALVVLHVTVTTEYGTFTEEIEIHTELPWKVATGLRDVQVGNPVLLHGKEQAAYDWTLLPPTGSGAVLMDATSRNPYFTPDVSGLYEIEVTDEATANTRTIEVFAGTWRGVIVDQDINGRPVATGACTGCHNDELAPDKFTPWMESGHAEIFTDNLDTSTHYGSSCFGCHTVGYDPDTDNGGIDEAPDYPDFLDAGLLNNPGDNWTTTLEQFPDTAQLANIQCENCHGPQDSAAHGFGEPLGEPRISLASDVCGTCHGEPLRHARFQQWQLSGHSNYELAIDEGTSGSCSRCHTANGFLAWLPILLDDDPETDPLDDIEVTWDEDESHPQTCAACHDPHDPGTTSGDGSNATVRISGDTPPLIAGFQATDVGRGAICMTCHNSRRGLRNDEVYPDFVGTSEVARMPHGSAQTDLLMGQNAYLVDVGNRGSHSLVDDACVACHMEATPPPPILAYNLGGTNHTFFASPNICADCHSPDLRAEDVQISIQFLLDQVQGLVEDGWLELMEQLIAAGDAIDLDGDATIDDIDMIDSVAFDESRGQQALTVTLTGGVVIGTYRLSTIDVLEGGTTNVGALYEFADDVLLKAGWNWGLVNNDGSLGVHNPFFASQLQAAARDALAALSSTAPAVLSRPESRGLLDTRGETRIRRESRR